MSKLEELGEPWHGEDFLGGSGGGTFSEQDEAPLSMLINRGDGDEDLEIWSETLLLLVATFPLLVLLLSSDRSTSQSFLEIRGDALGVVPGVPYDNKNESLKFFEEKYRLNY